MRRHHDAARADRLAPLGRHMPRHFFTHNEDGEQAIAGAYAGRLRRTARKNKGETLGIAR